MKSYTIPPHISAVILDASVLVKWFLPEDGHVEARKIYKNAYEGLCQIYSPNLSIFEFGNTLIKKKLPEVQAHFILDALRNSPIVWLDMTTTLMSRTYDIAYDYSMTYYDASFIACAEHIQGELITDNFKHHSKYKGNVKIRALLPTA